MMQCLSSYFFCRLFFLTIARFFNKLDHTDEGSCVCLHSVWIICALCISKFKLISQVSNEKMNLDLELIQVRYGEEPGEFNQSYIGRGSCVFVYAYVLVHSSIFLRGEGGRLLHFGDEK